MASLTTLYSFDPSKPAKPYDPSKGPDPYDAANAANPYAGLTFDASGNLFGTTYAGGTNNNGTVFEIANSGGSYASRPSVLATFNGINGSGPQSGLIADAAGNLFGTTVAGGTSGKGTVFEIVKTFGGYVTTPTVLVSFDGANGSSPYAGLIADSTGNLFGTTSRGGPNDQGTVFEIVRTATGYAPTPTVLLSFNGSNGSAPVGGLFADAAGNIFGTTAGGGAGYGTLFEIVKTADGYASTPTMLFNFDGSFQSSSSAALIADADGNLFGTTSPGVSFFSTPPNSGTVFELTKTSDGYASAPKILVTFAYNAKAYPVANLIIDAAGNLFGTASGFGGNNNNNGWVFEVAKTADGYASVPTVLFSFSDATQPGRLDNLPNGSIPFGSLIADASGNLFGTTENGGTGNYGTVFEITNTGFQVACYLTNTGIATPTGERQVESLTPGDLVLTASGEAHPITWIGHRHIAADRHRDPGAIWPIRIAPGAFGPNLPHRDLYLSPDHAVFIDGVLIPIRYLVNGRTIRQEPRDRVTYWHVELAEHDVLLAEGLPCESYLDTGNRAAFANGGPAIQAHPDFALRIWEAESCAPLVRDGAHLQAARSLLLEQAEILGHATTRDPAPTLRVGDRVIAPEIEGRRHRFHLPAGAETARLTSRSTIPAQILDDSHDDRQLGIAVSRIWFDGVEIGLEDPALRPASGWQAMESNGENAHWRWTDGSAALAVPGVDVLDIEIAITHRYWLGDTPADNIKRKASAA